MFKRHEKLLGKCFEKLEKSRIMIAGIGGLGSTVSVFLTRVGVGSLILVDPGIVDEPDLNRQILYHHGDVGLKKLHVARGRLREMNPDVKVEIIDSIIDENFSLPKVDMVVDCLDNFKSRFVLEELVWRSGIPMVHGGVKGFSGQVTVLKPGKTEKLKNIFGEIEDDPKPPQVFPPIVSLIGSIQVSETIKLICGDEEHSLANKLLVVDLEIPSFEIIHLSLETDVVIK